MRRKSGAQAHKWTEDEDRRGICVLGSFRRRFARWHFASLLRWANTKGLHIPFQLLPAKSCSAYGRNTAWLDDILRVRVISTASLTHCFTTSLNQLQGQGEVPILALPKIVKIARLASGIHVEAGARPHPCMSPPRHDLPDTKRGDWAEHAESRPGQEKSESAALSICSCG